MAVVNDFPGLYEKIRAYADGMARSMGIDPKAIYAFFNERGGHFPQTLQELNAFLDTPDPTYGYARRDPSTGALRFIGGGQPTPGLTPEQRGGFAGHFQNNAGDFDIQRFQDVDPRGVPWGGSWDPQFNTAHPELRGSGFDTPLGASLGLGTALSPGPTPAVPAATGPRTTGRGAQGVSSQGFDANNYVADAGDAFVSVVNGQVNRFEKAILGSQAQAMAEQDFNARGGAGASAAPSASGAPATTTPTGTAPATTGSTTSSSGGFGGNVGANPADITAANTAADNAATIAYQNKRIELDRELGHLLDEREKMRIALEAARDAWNKTYQTATLSGYMPGGAGSAGNGQKVLDAMTALRSDPAYQAADGNGKRAMEAARIVQATGGAMTQQQALAAVEQLRATTAAAGGVPSNAAQIEGILNAVAPGQATREEKERQDRAAMDALRLLSTLRGPENAFAYANTLANLPASIRQSIAAATSRLGMTAQNPAAAGLMNDTGWQGSTAAVPPAAGPRTSQVVPEQNGVLQAYAAQQAPAPGTADAAAMAAYRAALARQQQTGTEQYYVQPGTPQYAAAQQQFAGAPRIQTVPLGATAQTAATASTAATGGNQPAYGPRTATAATAPTGATAPSPAVQAGMPSPSQLSPTDWNRTDPYAKALLLAGYENAGEDKDSVMWRYKNSLPAAVGPRTGRLRAA